MANTDKNILITPARGSAVADPTIVFSGANSTAGPSNITATITPASNGSLVFSGSQGNLLIIANDLGNAVQVPANLRVTNTVSANLGAFTNITGNGAGLTDLPSGNITGQVPNALVAGTVYTNAQPNITSVGTLTSLSVSGNANVGNLGTAGLITATGNVTAGNLVTSGRLSATGNANVGNIGATNGVFTNISGNGSGLTNLPSANIVGQVANALVAGTVYTNAQPNITSVGTLTSLSVSGNANVGNLGTAGLITATGNIQGGNLRTTGLLSVGGNANVGNLGTAGLITATGNIQGGNLRTTGLLSVGGNANVGNIGATNGVFTNLSGTFTGEFANGNSNISIPSANGNINFSVGGQANEVVFTSTGANVNGYLSVAGNTNASNIILGTGSGGDLTGANLISANTINAATGITTQQLTSNTTISAAGTITAGNIVTGGTLSATGNANVGNIGAVNGVFTNVSGNGAGLTNLPSGNITGQVANALVAGTVYTNAQPNITSVGTLTSLSVSGNANVGNIGATNGVFTNISGNGAAITYANASNLLTGTVPTGRISGSYTGITGTGTLAAGSITNTFGNINIGSNVFTGNGSGLTSLPAGSITGQVANALVAGTVYVNAQPNITSVGTLTSLSISGNLIVGDNLFVNGNLTYLNVTTIAVEDPIIQLQTGANGAALTSNTGKDVGTALNYYDTAPKTAFMGWDVSNAEIAFGANVGITNEVVTFTQLANTRSGNTLTTGVFATTLSATGNANVGNIGATNGVFTNISGNGSGLTNLPAGSIVGQISNALVAGTVYVNAQPNITSVGTLTSLSVSGNANVGNIGATNGVFTNISGNGAGLTNLNGANVVGAVPNATYATTAGSATTATSATTAGTVTTNAQPNITSVGTLTSLSVSGNANIGNLGVGIVTATGNITAPNFIGNFVGNYNGVFANGNSNISIPTANGNINFSIGGQANEVVFTSTGANINGYLSVSGNANIANLGVAGIFATTISATGNANLGNVGATNGVFTNISGNGAGITGVVATTAQTVTNNAQPNITSVGTLTSLSVSGNANVGNLGTAGAITATGNITANFFFGNGSQLTGIVATTAQTVTNNAQPNITSVGTLTSLSVSGNANVGNLGTAGAITATGNITASYFFGNGSQLTGIVAITAQTVTNNAQPNITSVGTLTSLSVSGNANVGNLGTAGLITATGNIQGGNLRTGGALSVTGNANIGNIGVGIVTATGNITAPNFIGNFVGNINGIFANGNSNVAIPTANGNINFSIGGQANEVVFTSTGANINGYLSVSGNSNTANIGVSGLITATGDIQGGNLRTTGLLSVGGNANVGNLGTVGLTATGNASFTGANVYISNVANLKIPGGTSGYVLTTDGTGNLSWVVSNNQIGGAFVHTQSVANTTWVITHNLGVQIVNIEIVDTTGNSWTGRYNYPRITFNNTTTLTVTFDSAQAGYAAVTSGGGQQGPSGTSNVVPGGSSTQVQFNDGGVFNGSAGFTFNKFTNAVSMTGALSVTGNATSGNVITNNNLIFASQASRIIGDFSNANLQNRTTFVGSTANNATIVQIAPNGTGNVGGIFTFSGSNVSNSQYGSMYNFPGALVLDTGNSGSTTAPDLWFAAGGKLATKVLTNGNILFNKTTEDDSSQTGFYFSTNGRATATINESTTSLNTWHLYNMNATNNGYRFYVNTNGGVYNYQANDINISDQRVKKDIRDADFYLEKLCLVPVRKFKYKDQGDNIDTIGVIAQEMEVHLPELISNEGFGETPEDGTPLKTIYQTDLQYVLMKCIQELNAEVIALRERLNQLENK